MPTSAGAAGSSDESAHQLRSVRERIKSLRERLKQTRESRDSSVEGLRRTELDRAQALADLRTLSDQLQVAEHQATLAAEQIHLAAAQITGHKRAVSTIVQSAFRAGRRDRLRLLLSGDHPGQIVRLLAYSNYLRAARSRELTRLRIDMDVLAQAEARHRDVAKNLANLRQNKNELLGLLEVNRTERSKLVAALERDLKSQTGRLARLRHDEKRLADLVKELQKELAQVPLAVPEHKAFRTYQGRLAWPVDGTISKRFGTPRDDGHLRWQGVLIAGAQGAPVRAISYGRIAFADWLRGFGLILIVDHGNGFMSLYGHNQSLSKEVGDWVQDGDIIAHMGDSGGGSKPALYFEVRHAGRPQDPARWCKGQPAPAAATARARRSMTLAKVHGRRSPRP